MFWKNDRKVEIQELKERLVNLEKEVEFLSNSFAETSQSPDVEDEYYILIDYIEGKKCYDKKNLTIWTINFRINEHEVNYSLTFHGFGENPKKLYCKHLKFIEGNYLWSRLVLDDKNFGAKTAEKALVLAKQAIRKFASHYDTNE